MPCMPRGRAASALFKTGVLLFASSAVVTSTAAHSEDNANCGSFSSASTAGHPEDLSFVTPTYFACANGSFLTSVEGSYDNYVRSLAWGCSDQTKLGSLTGDSDGAVSLRIGITAVRTGVREGPLGFLADMYFEGYDGNSDEWKGPFGRIELYLPGRGYHRWRFCRGGSASDRDCCRCDVLHMLPPPPPTKQDARAEHSGWSD